MSKTTDSRWLELAEYTSLAASVAGSIAAIAMNQVIYAAAPLTLALSLNMASRQRLKQQVIESKQQTTESMVQLQQEVQSLQHQVQAPAETIVQLQQEVQSLQHQVQAPFDPSPLWAELEALKNRTQKLIETVEHLAPSTEVNQQITELRHQIESLPTPSAPVDLSIIEATITSIEQRLVALEQQQSTFVPQLDPPLDEELIQMHGDLEQHHEESANAWTEIEALLLDA